MTKKNELVKTPLDNLKSIMDKDSVRTQFQNALKENSGAFTASLIDLVGSDKGLQECQPQAVCMEALKAATLKLPINKQLGFAYIVGFKKVATFVLGYKGMIQLALRTGQYRHLNAGIVYDGEVVEENRLTGSVHIAGTKKSDKVGGYFAHLELMNGFTKTVWASKEEITAHAKKKCPSWKNTKSAWHTDFDSMAMKTKVRELLSKWGIMSTEMQKAMAFEDESDALTVEAEIKEKANTGSVQKIEPEPAMIWCPEKDQNVAAGKCPECKSRPGCPSHEDPAGTKIESETGINIDCPQIDEPVNTKKKCSTCSENKECNAYKGAVEQ